MLWSVHGEVVHNSDSAVQQRAERVALDALSEQLDVELVRGPSIKLHGATVQPDGATEDESILIEVFAHIGPLRGSQKHKVATDALKLVALRESRPDARLVLAFVDAEARDSVVGWRAAVLEHYRIERLLVDLDEEQRAEILEAQVRQKKGMAGAE